jgi:hypothetical protein
VTAAAIAALVIAPAGTPPPAAQPHTGLVFAADPARPDRYAARFAGGTVAVAPDGLWVARVDGDRGVALRLSYEGANAAPRVEPVDPLPTVVSYFVGADPARWRAGLPSWAGLRYVDLFPGVDLELRGLGDTVRQRFVVRTPAGAEALGRARLRVAGAERLAVDGAGVLVETALGPFRLDLPEVVGRLDALPAFAIDGLAVVRPFRVASAHAAPLDQVGGGAPDLLWATYLGGNNTDSASGIAVDAAGNTYVTGHARSTDFPTTPGAFQPAIRGTCDGATCPDAFVVKLGPDGALVYATYLGGTGGYADEGRAIAVDAAGRAHVAGLASSADFPVTPGAYQAQPRGVEPYGVSEAFVARLDPGGTRLEYSTFLGGSRGDDANAVAVDDAGHAYVGGTTFSGDFPATVGRPVGGEFDSQGFVSKLSPGGDALVYSFVLGGGELEYVYGLAVDRAGAAYATGLTRSPDFPATPGALRGAPGELDAFAAKVRPDGAGLEYATFLGGARDDYAARIAVDPGGGAVVVGYTSSEDFPFTAGAFRAAPAVPGEEGYVARLAADGRSLTYAAGLGSSRALAVALDVVGNAYVVGDTRSESFPVTADARQPAIAGRSCSAMSSPQPEPCRDAFVVKLSGDGVRLAYGSYLGGARDESGLAVALGPDRAVHVAGTTESQDFPTTPNAAQPRFGGTLSDGFAARMDLCPACRLLLLPVTARQGSLG